MSQQKLTITNLQHLSNTYPSTNTIHQHHQQWIINKTQFSLILQKFVSKQEELSDRVQELETEINFLKNVQRNYEKMTTENEQIKKQLIMQEKMILNQQQDYRKLQQKHRQREKEMQKIQAQYLKQAQYVQKSNKFDKPNSKSRMKIDELSILDHLDASTDRSKMQETKKKKILLKKGESNRLLKGKMNKRGQSQAIDIDRHIKDNQMAKLTSEIKRLKIQIGRYLSYISILQIQNQHFKTEAQITQRRQRNLHKTLINKLQKADHKASIKQDKENIDSCNFRTFELAGIEKEQQIGNYGFNKKQSSSVGYTSSLNPHKEPVLPPITPHFSTATFNFSYFHKNQTEHIDSSFFDDIFQASSQNQSERHESSAIYFNTQ